MKSKKGMRVAVFARNHRPYLEEAAERNAEEPLRPTTFRSSKRWTGAYEASVRLEPPLKIYFAWVGGQNIIEHQADVVEILLDPRDGDTATQRLLNSQPESTKGEGLWGKEGRKVKTLYAISRCERLAQSFPLSLLTKWDDGKPLSDKYSYSYSLVHEHQSVQEEEFFNFPEEVSHPSTYFEGATRMVSVNVYERNSAARLVCISHYGYDCAVCGFNFETVYGEMGRDFIHVHHRKSLSEIEEQYEVNPITDLIPVCPNCHAMIHRADPELSIENLRAQLRKEGDSKQAPKIR